MLKGSSYSPSVKPVLPQVNFFPNDVTVDKQGTIFVSDSNNTQVQIFAAQGHFSQVYGAKGNLDITFALNRGLALDELNRL
ncbi:MAG: hypothetical protein WA118_11225 [Carboxydocellales bacterium]